MKEPFLANCSFNATSIFKAKPGKGCVTIVYRSTLTCLYVLIPPPPSPPMHLGFLLLGLRVSFLYSPENGEDWQLGYIISDIGPKHYRSPNLRLGEFFFNRLIAGYHSPNSVRGRDTRELSRIFRLF